MRLRLVYRPDLEYVAYTFLADAARSLCLLALPKGFLATVAALDRCCCWLHVPQCPAYSRTWGTPHNAWQACWSQHVLPICGGLQHSLAERRARACCARRRKVLVHARFCQDTSACSSMASALYNTVSRSARAE